jgi:hypothetical protein
VREKDQSADLRSEHGCYVLISMNNCQQPPALPAQGAGEEKEIGSMNCMARRSCLPDQ